MNQLPGSIYPGEFTNSDELMFRSQHSGMSRAEWNTQRHRDRALDAHQAKVLVDYDKPMSGGTAWDRLQSFVALRDKTQAQLDALQGQKARLQGAVEAPAAVKAKRTGLLQLLAKKLIGGDEMDTSEAVTVDADIAAATVRADAAQLAVMELDKQIADKVLQVNRLAERQRGFVQDAMLEHVKGTYGDKYQAP